MMHFVKTSDTEVANELRKNNYTELSKQGEFFVFINEPSKQKTFDEKKVIYTNNLCV